MALSPPAPPSRDRPWLLPSNRKLRHLQGLTLRNLTLAVPDRARMPAIDDDANHNLANTPDHDNDNDNDNPDHDNNTLPPLRSHAPARPRRGLRRRSTLEWTHASPLARQKKLEDIAAGRMADTFFSLHVADHTDPVYISEVAPKAMNPDFRFFDLAPCGPTVTRLDTLTVKLWAKSDAMPRWQYLLEYHVHLPALHFIGKTLGAFEHPLPPNCILFHMTDGIYSAFAQVPLTLAPPKALPGAKALPSSSYDALMRLATLDDCIQDALTTRDRIADEIESILEANRSAISTVEQVPETEEGRRMAQGAVAVEKRRVDTLRRRRDELAANIEMRRQKMRVGRDQESQLNAALPGQKDAHKEVRGLVDKTEEDITGQRRRICEDLLTIYPIEPVPGKPLSFTIRGLLLVNSGFDDADADTTSAALGYVAHMVVMLSLYLAVILPYPISPHGSTSTISDPLAMNNSKETNTCLYPLYMKGVVRYRFEYGVFLLNKDIEMLSNALGLRPIDMRQTLPNLKYLVYVATAGKGELPARKAGGIKGLLRGDGAFSRKGSMDSTATGGSVDDHGFGNAAMPSLKQKSGVGLVGSRLRLVG
jgi:hypothetical protein